MNKESARPLYDALIQYYLMYYSFGFQMLVEDELPELKGAESGLKRFTLDHDLLKDARLRQVNIVGQLIDPLRYAIRMLGNLNAFPDMQELVDNPPSTPQGTPLEEDPNSLFLDLIKNIPDYESKAPIEKLFIRFVALHGTFITEISEIMAASIWTEAGCGDPLQFYSSVWEEQSQLLRPHADTNDLILLDDMTGIFLQYANPE